MKTTSYYAVFSANDIEKMIENLTGFHNMTIAHHFRTESLDYYVLNDPSGNCIDVFKSSEYDIPSGFFGMRANVDDFDDAVENLKSHGYTFAIDPGEINGNRHAVMEAPDEGFNVILFYHNRKD